MEENPYKAPAEAGAQERPLATKLIVFTAGAVLLAPACFMLGRVIIPPDDVALRFSIGAYGPALAIWSAYTWWRWRGRS